MKSISKKLFSALLAAAVILSAFVPVCISANAAETQVEAVSGGGVQERINSLLAVYPTNSYFTASGNVCNSNQSSDCQLSKIPSRGGLPSGATVSNKVGDAWSCCSFAKYAFYCIFGLSPKSCGTVSAANAKIGDYIDFGSSHYGIYLGQDTDNWYVYDSNYTSPPTNMVKYNHTIRKSKYSNIKIYRATNYNAINNDNKGLSVSTVANRAYFNWVLDNKAQYYNVKIWKNKLFDGDAYMVKKIEKDNNYTFALPAGTYQAYVDSVNWSTNYCKMSNVVTFTVQDSSPKLSVYPDGNDVYFNWESDSKASSYTLKIYDGKVWENDPYKTVWHTADTYAYLYLPAGTYQAYVDSIRSDGTQMGNVVEFTVVDSVDTDDDTDWDDDPDDYWLMGDVNFDGVVSIDDATYLQRILAFYFTPTWEELMVSDIDENGWIDVDDVTQIQRMLAKY